MREIWVDTSKSYRVCVGSGMLGELGRLTAPVVSGRNALIVSGSEVYPLYGEDAEASLRAAGFAVHHFQYDGGETSKTMETLTAVLECAAEKELARDDVFIALGGGVTGDITALAAALYKRGAPCVQAPTTLLAMVDSSVGGKAAVDLSRGKNLAGVFAQPALVVCDTDCLRTLPERVYNEGWAEIIKNVFLDGGRMHELLEKNGSIEEIIAACIETKAALVAADEQDRGVRRLLNFGHTIGHAIEWCSGYDLLHGEAVATGMSVLVRGCCALGQCDGACGEILSALLRRHGLPERCPYSPSELMEAVRQDKKRQGDIIALVLPESIGTSRIADCDLGRLERIIAAGV